MRDAVQPTTERFPLANRVCLAREDEKRRLVRVLSVLLVAQHGLTNAENHWPVTLHQSGEGDVVAIAKEVFQQLPIAELRRLLGAEHAAHVPENAFQWTLCHVRPPLECRDQSTRYSARKPVEENGSLERKTLRKISA